MSALTKSLPSLSPQRSHGAGAERAAASVKPSADAVAPPSQGLKPIGSTFANLAALYRAKAGE